MIDLRWGEATVEWISICSPALKSLRRAADKLEIAELVTALDVFWQHLTDAHEGRRAHDRRRAARRRSSRPTRSSSA